MKFRHPNCHQHLSKDRRPTVLARTPPTNSYSYPILSLLVLYAAAPFSPFCQRVLTKRRTLVDAHFKLVGEHSLSAKLQRWGVAVSRVPTRHSWGGGALERGHGAPLEPFAQFGDALGGVGTPDIAIIILVEAAELVVGQAASTGMWGVSMGALTEGRKVGPTAHLSEVTELPLSPSHSLVMPSVVYSPSPSSSRPQSRL